VKCAPTQVCLSKFPQVDDSRLPKDHPKPVIPPGVKQVYHKPQHLDAASRAATKAPAAAPTAAKAAAAAHLNRAPTAAAGRKLMGRQLLESPGQVGPRANCRRLLMGSDELSSHLPNAWRCF
jgi:hypothetical protein